MKLIRFFPILPILLSLPAGAQNKRDIDPQVIELEPFVVYEGLIDVVDGFTEEDYHQSNSVVDGFQETFNKILLGYHRKLLNEEYKHMVKSLEAGKEFSADL